jgi:hypothetical protein
VPDLPPGGPVPVPQREMQVRGRPAARMGQCQWPSAKSAHIGLTCVGLARLDRPSGLAPASDWPPPAGPSLGLARLRPARRSGSRRAGCLRPPRLGLAASDRPQPRTGRLRPAPASDWLASHRGPSDWLASDWPAPGDQWQLPGVRCGASPVTAVRPVERPADHHGALRACASQVRGHPAVFILTRSRGSSSRLGMIFGACLALSGAG